MNPRPALTDAEALDLCRAAILRLFNHETSEHEAMGEVIEAVEKSGRGLVEEVERGAGNDR